MTTVGVSTNCKHILHTTTDSWPAINTHTHIRVLHEYIDYVLFTQKYYSQFLLYNFAVIGITTRNWHSYKAVLILAGIIYLPLWVHSCTTLIHIHTHTHLDTRAHTDTHTRKKKQRKLSTVVRAKTTYNIGGNKWLQWLTDCLVEPHGACNIDRGWGRASSWVWAIFRDNNNLAWCFFVNNCNAQKDASKQ